MRLTPVARLSAFILVSACTCTLAAAPLPPYPVAPLKPVTDTYWGTTISDPYRWMEDPKDVDYQKFMKEESTYTENVLSKIPGRKALFERINSLANAGTVVYQVARWHNRYFYLKIAPGDETAKLYARDGLQGKERLLLDPDALTKDGVHFSLDWFVPSWDGRYVALGVSPGGSEDSVLEVIDATSGQQLAEHITRTQFGVTTWMPDNRSFLYNRKAEYPADAPRSMKYQKSEVFKHTIGKASDGSADAAVLGFGVTPRVPVDPVEIAQLGLSPDSKWAVAAVQKFVKNEISLYIAPAATVGQPNTPWVKIASEDDDITGFDMHGDKLYLLSHHDASRFKVLATSLAKPDVAHAKVIVAPSEAVIRVFSAGKDALYVRQLDGGLGRLIKVDFRTDKTEMVKLPYEGAISELSVNPTVPGALLKLTSWTQPQLWYAYDPSRDQVTETGLRPRSPVDYSGITSVEVKVPARDGVMVPLSIIYRSDLKMDGSHPTLLNGYGSYGITLDPGFDPTALAWLERGGVLAIAHVRGGGEYGDDWHISGQKLNKHHTWEDFIDCGEYLISKGFTTSAKLAGQGGSAGGITVGRAMTERPELFAAIIDNVGMSDAVRVETSPNGPTNISEFGTVKEEDGFKGLYAMSSFQHIKDGTPYPAVMFTTGINDPRVEPWNMAKMAARMQAASSSGKPVLLRVDYDAGHGIGSTKLQANQESADEWSFLLWVFGDPAFQPQ